MGRTFDVSKLERRMRSVEPDALSIELRNLAVEVGVALNVIELSPHARIVSGSTAHTRLLIALSRLVARIDALDELHEREHEFAA